MKLEAKEKQHSILEITEKYKKFCSETSGEKISYKLGARCSELLLYHVYVGILGESYLESLCSEYYEEFREIALPEAGNKVK